MQAPWTLMDMTRVNSAVRNLVSLDSSARNRAKRGIEPA